MSRDGEYLGFFSMQISNKGVGLIERAKLNQAQTNASSHICTMGADWHTKCLRLLGVQWPAVNEMSMSVSVSLSMNVAAVLQHFAWRDFMAK